MHTSLRHGLRPYIGTALVVILILLASMIMHFKLEHHVNHGSNDQQTAQDLSKITNALLTYGNKHTNLPNNINALHLKGLNAKSSNYTYKKLPPAPDWGPPGICSSTDNGIGCKTAGFTLCAIFITEGTKSFDYTPGKPTTATTFSYHRHGQQCYSYTYGQYGINGDSYAPVQ